MSAMLAGVAVVAAMSVFVNPDFEDSSKYGVQNKCVEIGRFGYNGNGGVKISPDLSVARVYLSVYPSDKTEAVMATIAENARALRGELGHKMGKQLRIIPELNFFVDNSLDYVEHLDELLKK